MATLRLRKAVRVQEQTPLAGRAFRGEDGDAVMV